MDNQAALASMQRLAIGMHHKGFSLIELLIVIVILAIAASFTVLAFGDFGRTRDLQTVTQHIKNRFQLAEDEALLRPAILSADISDHKIEFSRYNPTSHRWLALTNDPALQTLALGRHIQLNLNTPARIVFKPNGQMTPFQLNVSASGAQKQYRLTGAVDGHLSLQAN
jgi:general secretion pathway protein H